MIDLIIELIFTPLFLVIVAIGAAVAVLLHYLFPEIPTYFLALIAIITWIVSGLLLYKSDKHGG